MVASNRRQQPVRLEGVWLVTETPEGNQEVSGMSVVADARGFTLAGPEQGSERTIPWAHTTSFVCQRPARLPDGSPATFLEVGLSNGRMLQLMLPVTRVAPSETLVVETELAVMAEQYKNRKSPSEPQPSAAAAEPKEWKPSSPLPNFEELQVSPPVPERVTAGVSRAVNSSAQNGANAFHTNGSSPNGSGPSRSGTVVEEPEARPAETKAPDVKAPTIERTVDLTGIKQAPTASPPAPPAKSTVEAPVADSVPEIAPEHYAPAKQVVVQKSEEPETDPESRDRRESKMLQMLIALIALVVVVLLAELILVFFVLNHNGSSKSAPVPAQVHLAQLYNPR